MYAINPINTNYTFGSSVAITETPWTYRVWSMGEQAYEGRGLYEVIVEMTTDSPYVGIYEDPPTWKYIGAINKYKMLDNIQGTQTIDEEPLSTFTFFSTEPIDSVAILNCYCEEIAFIVEKDGGVIYSKIIPMVDNSMVLDWWEYFFLASGILTEIIVTDIPFTYGAEVQLAFSPLNGFTKIGELIVGSQFFIGWTQFDISLSIIDFSKKERDEFGNTVIIEGNYFKKIDYPIVIENDSVNSVYKFLQIYRAKPILWIGEIERPETIVYGFFRDFSIVISNPKTSTCSLQIEGI